MDCLMVMHVLLSILLQFRLRQGNAFAEGHDSMSHRVKHFHRTVLQKQLIAL